MKSSIGKKSNLNQMTSSCSQIAHAESKIIIKTKFAHPMIFGCEGDDDCNWCQNGNFGLIGLGEIEAEVELTEEGNGFKDIVGGHTAAGHLPSWMCQWCTLERLSIRACVEHDIQPIQGRDPDRFDEDEVLAQILKDSSGLAPFPWCSICLNAAFFKCYSGKKSHAEVDEGRRNEQEGIGCGLQLCEACAAVLVNEKEGDLSALIKGLVLEEKAQGFSLRADAELLCADGDLLRRFNSIKEIE